MRTKDPPESIDHRVEGHVQCQQEEADILLKTSGKQPEGGVRFFVQRLMKDINEIPVSERGKKPKWIPFDKTTDRKGHVYAERAGNMAKAENKPLVWRTGGGASLGIADMLEEANSRRLFIAIGTPRSWSPERLEAFLKTHGYNDITGLAPPRARWQGWIFWEKLQTQKSLKSSCLQKDQHIVRK